MNSAPFVLVFTTLTLRPPKRSLWENGLVYRYDTNLVDDGTGGGEEGRCGRSFRIF